MNAYEHAGNGAPAVDFEEFFKPAKHRAIAQIDKDMQIYKDYFNSGLTQREFETNAGLGVNTINNLKRKYDLPTSPIDHGAVKSAARKARKQMAMYMANTCSCVSAVLLRNVLVEKRYVA